MERNGENFSFSAIQIPETCESRLFSSKSGEMLAIKGRCCRSCHNWSATAG